MGSQSVIYMFAFGSLFLFGCLYAALVNWLRARGWMEGFTAFMVVGGVAVTLIVNKAIHHPDPAMDLLLEAACFAASGLPMVIEASFIDYALRRHRHEQSVRTLSEVDNA